MGRAEKQWRGYQYGVNNRKKQRSEYAVGKRIAFNIRKSKRKCISDRKRKLVLKKLNKLHKDERDGIVYVLVDRGSSKCYVGSTQRQDYMQRIKEHENKTGAEWTKHMKNIRIDRIISVKKSEMLQKEREITIEYMHVKGIVNVRGAIYANTILRNDQMNSIREEISYRYNLCFTCGSSTHFNNDCPVTKNNKREIVKRKNIVLETDKEDLFYDNTREIVDVNIRIQNETEKRRKKEEEFTIALRNELDKHMCSYVDEEPNECPIKRKAQKRKRDEEENELRKKRKKVTPLTKVSFEIML